MSTLTVTTVARSFSAVLDRVERDQEEIILVRRGRTIARLVPESGSQNALEIFGDLYRTLDDKTANALAATISRTRKGAGGTLDGLRDPWAS